MDRALPDSVVSGDRRIPVREYPASEPAAVILVLHGLAEHSARYERFAQAAANDAFTVVTYDHRGHGPAYDGALRGHFADRHGWERVVDDVAAVAAAMRAGYPGLPLVLMGHSMGSFVAQSAAMRHPELADRLVLSGSSSPNRGEAAVARALARIIGAVFGRRSRANLLDRMSFGKFNDRFKPNRTTFDWLSRDESEVDHYVADPLCGFVASNRLWFDLLGGVLEITAEDAIGKLPKSLPVLMFGGELDPVGGRSGIERLAERYRAAGMRQVDVKIYDGGRHEMLNEINRREVTRDVFAWISASL